MSSIQRIATGFSLSWLFLANLVGLLLAALLVWPSLNGFLAPYTFGRWVPLHMDWQLYGWCSLPLLGLILRHVFDGSQMGVNWSFVSFSLWSLGLIASGASWLSGGASGKLFLNWGGFSGSVFGGALIAIWVILTIGCFQRFLDRSRSGETGISLAIKGCLVVSLLGIPAILLKTSDPTVYPPVNPDSGGATGHSLLASSLGIVFLMGLLPRIGLGLGIVCERVKRRAEFIFWGVFSLSIVLYLSIEHGNASNASLNQVLGLGSLLAWPLLVWFLWKSFKWTDASKLWRMAFLFWWAFLTIDGWVLFLPGILNTLKFTNALVAHSHLAMGGMATALNMVILIELGGSKRSRNLLSLSWPFWIWNSNCLLYVLIMTVQGWREGLDPSVLLQEDTLTSLSYGLRLVVGAFMALASAFWVARFARELLVDFRKREAVDAKASWQYASFEAHRKSEKGIRRV